MKFATRMTLAVGAAAVVLFGAGGAWLVHGEARDLRTVAAAETLLLAQSLQTAVENALRDRQADDVAETLRGLQLVDPAVSIFVYSASGALWGASGGARPNPEAAALAATMHKGDRPRVAPEEGGLGHSLRVAVPLGDEAAPVAATLVVERTLDAQRRDLAATRRLVILSVLAFVLAVAALTWLLTRRQVSAPLARMVADMRRVRAGDLRPTAEAGGGDEVGLARQEFHGLVRALHEAREAAEVATESHRRLERALQSADKLITLGQLAAVLAHEIGSPLQVLHGRARTLLKSPADAENTRKVGEILVSQSERITDIVAQMMSLARRRPPHRQDTAAGPSVRAVLALLAHEARRRGVQLVEAPVGSDRVHADPDQLQQMVLNLVRNALDASPADGRVTVRHGGDGPDYVLDVLDQGPPVPAAERPRLFEPFVTTRGDSGGTGLGLTVVRALVQEHGGALAWLDGADAGTVLRVSLPREAPTSEAAPPAWAGR